MDFCQQSNVCFSTYCLSLSLLSCQEAIVFWFHGCSNHPQWFWSSRRGNLSLLLLFPLLFAFSNGARCHDLDFLLALSQLFHSSPSPSLRGSLVPLLFLPLEWYHLHTWDCWCFTHLSWFQLVTHSALHSSWCAQHNIFIININKTYCPEAGVSNYGLCICTTNFLSIHLLMDI